jgi:hypothetical protein
MSGPDHDSPGEARLDPHSGQESEKLYAAPRLTVYGTIDEITKAVGTQGSQDGPIALLRTGFPPGLSVGNHARQKRGC